MSQRLAFLAAASLGAFIAVLLGAVGAYVLLKGASTAPPAAASGAAPGLQAPAPDFGTANGQPQGRDTDNSGPSSSYQVSSDQAAAIALNSAPGASLLSDPRLVNMNGIAAYEVPLDRGMVYVDANSGQVLYNAVNGGQTQPGSRFRRHTR